MKFKTDENLPGRVTDFLRSKGHDAVTVLDQMDAGTEDSIVASLVRDEGRIFITLDLDFADIRTYRPSEYSGIIILRPRQMDSDSVYAMVERLVVAFKSESPSGQLWIVGDDRIRIRGDSRQGENQ